MSREPTPLADRMRRLRELGEISPRFLGKLAGFSPSLLGQLERGELADLKTETASRIAAVLGVSLDFLVRGNGVEPSAEHVKAAVAAATALQPKQPKPAKPVKAA